MLDYHKSTTLADELKEYASGILDYGKARLAGPGLANRLREAEIRKTNAQAAEIEARTATTKLQTFLKVFHVQIIMESACLDPSDPNFVQSSAMLHKIMEGLREIAGTIGAPDAFPTLPRA